MKVKVKPRKSRLVVTLENQIELYVISTALTLVDSSDEFSEAERIVARNMLYGLPENIEATND